MTMETPLITYTGGIRPVLLGAGASAVTVGGETSYPFYLFEGAMPHPPRIAIEVYDAPPTDWPEAAVAPYRDVLGDPAAWARKAVGEYGAELVCLQLASTDPNGANLGAEEAARIVKNVADAVSVPLIVWGSDSLEKDTEVMRVVSEVCQGRHLILGPVLEGNYKKIGASAMAYKHTVVTSTPMDINLAKQLNILVGNLGVGDGELIMDPLVSSIGYGIEYVYSVMERIRMAALVQQDEKLQVPMICNIARETWKTKEAKVDQGEDPRLGDAAKRGIALEAMSAMLLLLAGADILVMRHPEAIRLIREMIAELSN